MSLTAKEWLLLPEEVTFEEWEKAGYPIGWRKQRKKYDL